MKTSAPHANHTPSTTTLSAASPPDPNETAPLPDAFAVWLRQMLSLLSQAEQLCASMPGLPAEQRVSAKGKQAARYAPIASLLAWTLSTTGRGDPAARAIVQGALDVAVGALDGGTDAARFEPSKVATQLSVSASYRVVAQRLERLKGLLDDQSLLTGNPAVERTLVALDIVRALNRSVPAVRAVVAPVLEATRQMTAAARASHLAETPGANAPTETSPPGSGV